MATIILLATALVLFIISFFVPDRVSQLEKNVEELSLQHMQDVYQLKKKVRILEEELLAPDSLGFSAEIKNPASKVNEILKNQVLALYAQGLDPEAISKRSALSTEEIGMILQTAEMGDR
ncbi:hypothetical protein [Bacillus testis]|uniref:hypothetical protein n=1 Tax=Bacillus testis TaxID=1622072 RepID=UPI00067F0AF2|nr:hypothetical protein [Bacillus testis]